MFSGKNGKELKDIKDRVEAIADDVGGELKDFGREARESADDLKKSIVKQLYESARSMRKEARDRGARGDTLKNIDGMAKGLERAANYLKWHSYEDMGEDIEKSVKKTVKRSPLQVLLIVFAVGLIIGLIMRGNEPPRPQNPSQY